MQSLSVSVPSLEKMTKKELLNFAEENNIEGLNERMLKTDIISAVEEVIE